MSTGINIAPSSDLTVGTTAVTSGTDGRVFFQAGGVVQQDANFTYDNTLKRLGLKAVGTASTDIPFLIQDSAGTGKLFQATGDGKHSFNMSPNTNFSLSIDQTNQNGGLAVYSSGQAIFTVAKVAGSVGYISVLNSGNATFFSGNTSYFNHSLVVGSNSTSPGARLDVRAQGALSTDIAFRVRNSADTSDLISFRGDGSEWIQSVPFRHGAYLTGGTNTAQGLFIGYNVASLSSTSDNCVVIGRGTGSVLQGSGNTIIGHAFSQGTVSNSIGLGRGVFVNGSNQFITGSELYPTNTWLVSTGGEVTTGANLRGLDFKVSGTATGPSNISASPYPVRFYSPNGTGSGAGSNIQFHVAPSNTGGAAFNKNIFSEMFTIRGEADGLNHYQLSTPRVPSASITDGYIQYSNDITAGNAAPHFRTEAGDIIKLYKETTAVTAATLVSGLGTPLTDTDTFDGYTLKQIVKALRNQGLLA
jgi:hypothetical protein